MDLTPIFRVEFFLDAIINSTTPPEPIFRKEFYLAKIAGADVPIPSPVFREEYYLAKLCGEDVEIPEPIFRKEFWLAKKCGEDVTTPTPIFREEYWLEEWVNGSSPQYETLTGKIVSFLTQRIAPLKIEATLSPIQDLHGYDAPWPPGGGKNLAYKTISGANIYSSGTIAGDSNYDLVCAKVVSGNTYVFSVNGTITSANVAAYYDDDPEIGSVSYNGSRVVGVQNPFTAEHTGYVAIRLNAGAEKVQIEQGSTVSPYSHYSNICPISGHTGADIFVKAEYDAQATPSVTISFGQTVYGGTLTINEDGTGSVVAENYSVTLSSAKQVNYKLGGANKYVEILFEDGKAANATTQSNAITSMYPVKQSGDNRARLYGSEIDVYDNDFIDQATAASILSDFICVYKLATPFTINLTASQVNALQGNNTVWVDDSSEIKVTFRSN